jgi:diguanylate cyclase (GGDEF)-like protein/PAS domain S-box-containing protein
MSGLYGGDQSELFRIIAEESPAMVFISSNGKMTYVNRHAAELTGYTRDEMMSPEFDLFRLITGDPAEVVTANYEKECRGQDTHPFPCTLRAKNGRSITAVMAMRPIQYQGRTAVLGFLSAVDEPGPDTPVTSCRQVFNLLTDNIHVVDQDLRVVLANEVCRALNVQYGCTTVIEGKMLGEAFPFLSEGSVEKYREVLKTGEPFLVEEIVEINGRSIYWEHRIVPVMKDGHVAGVVGVVRDLSAPKQIELELKAVNDQLVRSNQKLKDLAITDAHTGLFNHRYLEEVLDKTFLHAKRQGSELSLVMLDLDYFKSINDVYGHRFGDLVLKQFSAQLKKMVRRSNSVIRYGGEEFVIVAPDTGKSGAMRLGHRILDTIGISSFGDKYATIKLKISLAVVSYPEDGFIKPMDMLERAEQILNKAKESGGNRLCCVQDLKVEQKPGNHASITYLKEKMERLNKRANQGLIEAIFAFAKTIEMKDHYTGEHVEQTVHFATMIAESMNLSKEEVLRIRQAAILHDLGKIGISEQILQKPSKLTSKEFKEIKKHPLIGVDIIRPIHLLHDIVPLIMYHHERWDGKGYPEGLSGEDIPVGARIIALADTYQALISNRPYRKAYGRKEAKEIIQRLSGTQFDPVLVNVFLKKCASGAVRPVKR